jgi:hypothetical protein
MTDPLAVYLHDHLAGFRGAPLGNFAAAILPEIEQDREVLKGIVDRLGEGHADLKEAAAWFAERPAGSSWRAIRATPSESRARHRSGARYSLFRSRTTAFAAPIYQQLGKRAEARRHVGLIPQAIVATRPGILVRVPPVPRGECLTRR